MIYKTIKNCGLCNSERLETYLDLGVSPLANRLKIKIDEEEPIAPLKVIKCNDCDCFQLSELVDPKILFSTYTYQTPNGLKEHFKEYAHTVFDLLKPKQDELMLGIGGNTGILEKEFQNLGMCTANVEPAQNIAFKSRENGVFTINSFFDRSVSKYFKNKAKLICSNNVFAHCDLDPIIDGIKCLLDKDGILVIEAAYWLDTIKNSDAFQIYHEHYKYLSIKPLHKFFNANGFNLFKVTYNKVQCGSFRAFIKWKDNKNFEIDDSVDDAIKKEEEFGLYKKETYDEFRAKLDKIKEGLKQILEKYRRENKKMGIYSVAAKTVLLLKYMEIADYFEFATDDSELKWNKFIPETSIKILSKEEFWAQKFGVLFCGAYNFFDYIVKNNPEFKGTWVNPLPEIRIV